MANIWSNFIASLISSVLSLYLFALFNQVGDATDNVQVVPKSNAHVHAVHGKRKGTSVHENLNSSELFNLYTMLNDVKVDLLWGRNSEEQPEEKAAAAEAAAAAAISSVADVVDSSSKIVASSNASVTSRSSHSSGTNTPAANQQQANSANSQPPQQKGHVRRPSTVSVASSNSTNTLSSDSDSELSNENDSGIESEPNRTSEVDKSNDLARQYRQHLLGLYRCLEQMTEAANYLTNRYQSDVGPV